MCFQEIMVSKWHIETQIWSIYIHAVKYAFVFRNLMQKYENCFVFSVASSNKSFFIFGTRLYINRQNIFISIMLNLSTLFTICCFSFLRERAQFTNHVDTNKHSQLYTLNTNIHDIY